MGRIERFEDIDCWKEARQLVKLVYSLTNKRSFSIDRGLKDQIQRAAISIMSNIAEGFESQGNREFVQFLFYAKRSSGEVRAQLYAAYDLGYINEVESKEANELAIKVSKMLSSFISYLKSAKKLEGWEQ
jgi:four helix bundle protein